MHTQLLQISHLYINQFRGLSQRCWQSIYLALFEASLMGVLYYLSVYFVNELKLNMAQAGLLISCYGVGAMLGGYVSGLLAAKIKPKFLTVLSLFLQGCCYFSLAFYSNTLFLMINLFSLGIASYAFITANQLCVLASCEKSLHLKAINLLSTASNLGLALSAIIISALIHFGFYYIFINTGVLLLITSIYLLQTDSSQPNMENLVDAIHTSSPNIKHRSRMLVTVLCCVFIIGSIVAQLGAGYAIYIHDHFPKSGIHGLSLLFALNSLLVVLFETPLGNLCTDSNKFKMIGLAGFLIGFGMYMLTLSSQFSMAVIACIVYTIGEMLFFCLTQYVCYQLSPNSNKGQGLGLFRLVYASSRIAGPAIGGAIYHQAGGDALWLLCGLMGLVCLVLCLKQARYQLV